jgi:carnitine O-acetyltransferase
MDGTPTARLCSDVLSMIASSSFSREDGRASSSASLSSAHPTPIDWDITPTMVDTIREAAKGVVANIEGHSLSFTLTRYGKKSIKEFGVSPDSWAQMILQLAYGRLFRTVWTDKKRAGGTYEAATTRRFLKGRTEAIRVVTTESDAWVRSMDDPSLGKEERKRLFKEAVNRHGADARRSGTGMGVDRHMFGCVSCFFFFFFVFFFVFFWMLSFC